MSAGCFCAFVRVLRGGGGHGGAFGFRQQRRRQGEVVRAQAGEGVVQEVLAFLFEPAAEDGDGFRRQCFFGGGRGRYQLPAVGALCGGLSAVGTGKGKRGVAVGAAFGAAVGKCCPGGLQGGRRGGVGAVGLFCRAEQGGVEQGGEHGFLRRLVQ